MKLTAIFSGFLFLANTIRMVSADQCAAYTPTQYSDSSFLMALHKTPLHSTLDNIPGTLHNYVIKLVSPGSATTALTTYDIGFDISVTDSDESVSGVLYPDLSDNVTVSNFISVYKAFLVPPTTGDYIFSLDGVSDGASFFIYDNRAMYCCDDMDLAGWLDESSNFCYIPEDADYQTSSMTVSLEAGLGYVIVYAYTNHGGDAVFKPSMTLPSGEVVTNFDGYVHGSVEDSQCGVKSSETTTYTQGTVSYNTTYSTAVVTFETLGEFVDESYTDVETVYYIMTPAAASSSAIASSSSEVITSSSVSESSSVVLSATSSVASSLESSTVAPASAASIESSVQSSVPASSKQSTAQSSAIASEISSVSTDDLVSSTSSQDISNSLSISVSTESVTGSSNAASALSSSVHSTSAAGEDAESRDSSNNDSMTTSTYTDVNGITRTTTVKCSTASDEGSMTTSTYTDVNGITRTTTVKCSTASAGVENNNEKSTQTVVTVTTYTCTNGDVSVSTITRTEVIDAAKATGKESKAPAVTSTINTVESSAKVQIQSSSATSSASLRVQDTPNAAGKYATGLLFSVMPLAFALFM